MSKGEKSLPARGAWIEIVCFCGDAFYLGCRSPHGERGLKFLAGWGQIGNLSSLPARGAWIEILYLAAVGADVIVAPRTGSVD